MPIPIFGETLEKWDIKCDPHLLYGEEMTRSMATIRVDSMPFPGDTANQESIILCTLEFLPTFGPLPGHSPNRGSYWVHGIGAFKGGTMVFSDFFTREVTGFPSAA